jgi:hypothetical protein
MKLLHVAAVALLAQSAFSLRAWAHGTPSCVHWSGITVATAVGYNHVVRIDNACDRAATCTVSTDVAPTPIQAAVPPKQRVELVTFRRSPAYTFKARASCILQ